MNSEASPGYYPDGLTEEVIDALLGEVDAAVAVSAGPSGALLDGSAAVRRDRRVARRAAGAVVRVLPVVRVVSDGREAA